MEMEYVENPQIRRSISMPVKPRPLEPKSLQRSEEKEQIFNSADYYPESPELPRSSKLHTDNGITRSANTFPCTTTWVGSTIELNRDAFSVASDTMYEQKRRTHRVIEKNGNENVNYKSIPQKSWRYFRDFVTTLVRPFWRLLPKQCLTPIPTSTTNLTNTINATSIKDITEQSYAASCADCKTDELDIIITQAQTGNDPNGNSYSTTTTKRATFSIHS